MTDLTTSLLQKASGENRINPDEQRTYLGTFRERVVLLFSLEQATHNHITQDFDTICHQLSTDYKPLFLKISPALSDTLQISLIKIAQKYAVTTSIIEEKISNSPYALVFHTDYAVNKEDIRLETLFPQFKTKTEKKEEKAPSFWKKLFG